MIFLILLFFAALTPSNQLPNDITAGCITGKRPELHRHANITLGAFSAIGSNLLMIMLRTVFCSAGLLSDGFLRLSFITFAVFYFMGFKIGIRSSLQSALSKLLICWPFKKKLHRQNFSRQAVYTFINRFYFFIKYIPAYFRVFFYIIPMFEVEIM